MTELAQQACTACQSSALPVGDADRANFMHSLPGWNLVSREGVLQLEREFSFRDFKQAWHFANKVAQLAELEHHHPTIILQWGKVTVNWWTHAINGLHCNDFILAARTDTAY